MYTSDMAKAKKRRATPKKAAENPVGQPFLLQLTLHEGGLVTIDKRKIAGVLLEGIEYRALSAILLGLHELQGELIKLAVEARILDVRENPVVDGPLEPQ